MECNFCSTKFTRNSTLRRHLTKGCKVKRIPATEIENYMIENHGTRAQDYFEIQKAFSRLSFIALQKRDVSWKRIMEKKEVLIDENEINFKIRDNRKKRQGLNPTRKRKGTDFSKGLV